MPVWIKHYERGKRALRSSRPREAVRHFRKAKEAVEIDCNPILAGTLFMRLSAAEMACHQFDAASAAAQNAVAIAEHHVAEAEGRKLLVSSATVLACVTAARGESDMAMILLHELLARIAEFDVPGLAAEPLEALADLHLTKHGYPEAERLYKQSYDVRSQSDPTSEEMLALLDRLAEVCDLNGHREEAERFAELSTECAKKHILASGDPVGRAVVQEHDRLLAEKKRILADALIDEAVEIALAPLKRRIH